MQTAVYRCNFVLLSIVSHHHHLKCHNLSLKCIVPWLQLPINLLTSFWWFSKLLNQSKSRLPHVQFMMSPHPRLTWLFLFIHNRKNFNNQSKTVSNGNGTARSPNKSWFSRLLKSTLFLPSFAWRTFISSFTHSWIVILLLNFWGNRR